MDRFTDLNAASAGLVPASALRPAHEFEAELAQAGTTGVDEDNEVGILEDARNAAARLLHADPSTISIDTSFTEALAREMDSQSAVDGYQPGVESHVMGGAGGQAVGGVPVQR